MIFRRTIEKHELVYSKLQSGQHHIGRYHIILRQGALIKEECNEIEFWT